MGPASAQSFSWRSSCAEAGPRNGAPTRFLLPGSWARDCGNAWGRSACDIFEDASNSPASLIAARRAFAVAETSVSCACRDAKQAYLQAAMEIDLAIVNLVVLPEGW